MTARVVTAVAMLVALGGRAGVLAAPLPFTGVNLAGGEFYEPKPGMRPAHGRNFIYPTQDEIAYFAAQGMNVFRVPFRWETLQPDLGQPLLQDEVQRLKECVRLATSRKLAVILDPHNYARHYGRVIGGPEVSAADFADFWRRLAAEFAADPYVWFGLMNEPHSMPTKQWFDAANAAIAAIRGAGARNLILVPGNAWTGAHSWAATWYGESNAQHAANLRDPFDHWAIEVHQYLDQDSSGSKPEIASPTIGSERVRAFTEWCRAHRRRAFLGEFAVPAIPDGERALSDLLAALERDRDVWLGWTWWAAGAWWGDYMFSLEPKDGQDRPQMAWLRPHLNGTRMPAFRLTVAGGRGTADIPAGETRTISADPPPPGRVFDRWTGDTAWLANPLAARTTIRMPFRPVDLRALFRPAGQTGKRRP